MSSSLVHNNILFIGTYVDTLFMLSIPDFERIAEVKTQDSILSIVAMSDELLCVG
jgi:hypothetical protein